MYKFLLQKKVLATLISIVVVASGATTYVILSKKTSVLQKFAKKIIKQEEKFYCKVDGSEVKEEDVDKKPLAIMVENSSTVRPQSGLSQACMVFEALAEGGITRFLTIYSGHRNVKTIGPVRSARPYYVELATAFDPVYAHVGGSTVGLQKITEVGIDDFDQFSYESSFWRDQSLSAPHNVFTSTEKLRKGAIQKNLEETTEFTGFEFRHKKAKIPKRKQIVGIDFSYAGYYVSYEYKYKTNSYDRYNAHILQKDSQNNKTISPKNVVVMFAKTSASIGPTLDIDVIGKGQALYFYNGRAIKGTWEKDEAQTQIGFYDSKGETVKLNAGQTWVEVVKTDTAVTY